VVTKAARRARWMAVALAVALVAGCESSAGGSSDSVTIPSSDGSSPSITMDAHFNVESRPFLTVTHGSSDQQANAQPGETVTFLANGQDRDGGVERVQIWATFSECSGGDGEARTCSSPGLVSQPRAESVDADPGKGPGDVAATSRVTQYNLTIEASVEARVWAIVENFSGDRVRSATITIDG